jgi:hypothetical protein
VIPMQIHSVDMKTNNTTNATPNPRDGER